MHLKGGGTKVGLFPEYKGKLSTSLESSITPESPQPARSVIDSSRKPDSKESESLSTMVKNENNHKKVIFKHCKKCGGVIDPKSRVCTDCRKQYFVPRYGVPIIILSVLLAVCIGISALVFYYLNESQYEVNRLSGLVELKNNDIRDLRTENEKLRNTISTDGSFIDELIEKNESLATEATWFHDICDYLNSGTIGYAESNFYVDESIVLVHRDEDVHKTKLTAYWKNGGSVSYRPIGACATISLEDETWSTSTYLNIEPLYNGVMEVWFFNDVDDTDFKMIIIVVD